MVGQKVDNALKSTDLFFCSEKGIALSIKTRFFFLNNYGRSIHQKTPNFCKLCK